MTTTNRQPKVIVVGAGMGGTLMAIFLARRGYQVEVYERRQDLRTVDDNSGRSFKMTLSPRGISVLKQAEVFDDILPLCVVLRGRMVHALDGSLAFHTYGKNDDEVLYSVTRNKVNATLIECAHRYPQIKFYFEHKCLSVDKERAEVILVNENTGENVIANGDFVVGADGCFSTVRNQIQRGERADYHQQFLPYGYKELNIPEGKNGEFLIDKNSLHVWARKGFLLLALPNHEGSFNCMCVMPYEGPVSFEKLTDRRQVEALFNQHFHDIYELVPGLVDEFLTVPTGHSLTVSTYPWHFQDKVVLVGDSCHSVVPYYGQGMIAAFEDCAYLDQCLGQWPGDLNRAFSEYQEHRKPHIDVLARLSLDNFEELRMRAESPRVLARKKVDIFLNRLFPSSWLPAYTLIAHTNIPFGDAMARLRRQNRVGRWLGVDVATWVLASFISLRRGLRGLFGARPRVAERPPITGEVKAESVSS